MFLFYFDPLYLLMVAPAIVLALYAQAKVSWSFRKYSRVATASGLAGAEVSKRLLQGNGLTDVAVEHARGTLSDYYDPRRKILALSPDVFGGNSVAAVGVAAHETGHALQDARGYFPMRIRSGLLPVANIGSQLAWPLILIGFLIVGWLRSPFGYLLLNLGIIAFGLAVVFQVLNLPVEFNASRRAMAMLSDGGVHHERRISRHEKGVECGRPHVCCRRGERHSDSSLSDYSGPRGRRGVALACHSELCRGKVGLPDGLRQPVPAGTL